MKEILMTALIATAAFAAVNAQQKGATQLMAPVTNTPTGPIEPTPLYLAPTPVYNSPSAPVAPSAPQPVYVYDQKPLAQQPVLISPQEAQSIIDQFRSSYQKLGNPRILIYINRDLVDEQSGLKLSGRSETVTTRRTTDYGSTNGSDKKESVSTKTVANNNYQNNGQAQPTLTDRQTARDVERLMGRPLRAAGATLVDQRVAAQIMENRPIDSITLETEQARKDRTAVNQIADVVLEVLISSRTANVTDFNGGHVVSVPDIQITAIRLKDAKMIGQASATDVMNRSGGPGAAAQHFTVQDITEATSLALMNDILQEAK
jgi:hypothetical protein